MDSWDHALARHIRHDVLALPDSPIERLRNGAAGRSDIIGLETGETDLPTPQFICDAATAALRQGKTFYSHGRGILPLRQAIAQYHRRWHNQDIGETRIAVISSAMTAIMLVGQATLTRGDVAVVVTPAWPNVSRAFEILGARTVEVALDRDETKEEWSLDMDALIAACDASTRLIYLASPGNPTAWTIGCEQAGELMAFARARGITVLADEVYHRLVGPGATFSMLEAARPLDPLFVVNSFSKSYAMTGWRVGWLVGPLGCHETVERLVEFNNCGGVEFVQHGALEAIRHGEHFVTQLEAYSAAGRRLIATRLAGTAGVRVLSGRASIFTLFEVPGDANSFCAAAIADARVAFAPGCTFGRGGTSLVRASHARATALLSEAMNRVDRMMWPSSEYRWIAAKEETYSPFL